MVAKGLKTVDLARACGIQAGSVSGWFGKGKPTKMISGDNLVAVADFLGVSPRWVMTGIGDGEPSQHVRLDENKLAELILGVDAIIAEQRKRVPPRLRARIIAASYVAGVDSTGAAMKAVEALLSTILSELEAAQ